MSYHWNEHEVFLTALFNQNIRFDPSKINLQPFDLPFIDLDAKIVVRDCAVHKNRNCNMEDAIFFCTLQMERAQLYYMDELTALITADCNIFLKYGTGIRNHVVFVFTSPWRAKFQIINNGLITHMRMSMP